MTCCPYSMGLAYSVLIKLMDHIMMDFLSVIRYQGLGQLSRQLEAYVLNILYDYFEILNYCVGMFEDKKKLQHGKGRSESESFKP